MSNVSMTLFEAAASCAKFTYVIETSAAAPVPFAPYKWDPLMPGMDVSEAQATAGVGPGHSAIEFVSIPTHFFDQLPADLRDKCSIFTVTGPGASLDYSFTHQTERGPQRVDIRGHTDACLAPKNTHSVLPLVSSAALIDWMIPSAIKGAPVAAKLFFEILAFYLMQKRQPFAIATDCSSCMRVFVLKGRQIIEYQSLSPSGEWEPLSLPQGFGLVCSLLDSYIDAVLQWQLDCKRLSPFSWDSDEEADLGIDDNAEQPCAAAATAAAADDIDDDGGERAESLSDANVGSRKALPQVSASELSLHADLQAFRRQQKVAAFFQAHARLLEVAASGPE